jgi:hypothetical protein
MQKSISMIKTLLLGLTISFALLPRAISQPEATRIEKAEWIIGTWVNEREKGNIYESWMKFVVKDQNEGEPIRFALTELSEDEMKFENPEHDSPQVILYRKEGDNALLAEIWSSREGDIRKIRFPMKRVK